MPTTPARARKWLRDKRARVVSREPFTIQLRFATTTYVQPATVGVDTGSQVVGLAAITHGEVVLQAEVHLRTDIAAKLLQRRQYRRNRRSRKTRYRPARFANRRRPHGWLPPSIRSKAEATVKAVRWLASLLPVGRVHVEVASFDTQRMQQPGITGVAYQQGELFGYAVREYLLDKWQRRCAYCGAQGIPLQIEHLIPRARGGSDRVSNLTLACQPCNERKGTQTAAEFGHPKIQAQARMPLKDAAQVSALKTAVVQALQARFSREQVETRYGYETKYQRLQVLHLPKSHCYDAVAIACALGEVVRPLEQAHLLRCVPRGQYQRFNGPHSAHPCWAPRRVRGFRLYELVRVNGQVGYIAGRRLKGAFVIKAVDSGKKLAEIIPRKLQRLARPTHGWIVCSQALAHSTGKEGGASSPR